MLTAFCDWLAHTGLSQLIQNLAWIIPGVQTVHILSIAAVITSAAMLDLRLIGLAGRRYSMAAYVARFLPLTWGALVVLAVSGVLLIIGEPQRSLLNPWFQIKMLLLMVAIVITLLLQRGVRSGPMVRNDREQGGLLLKAGAAASLLLWATIVFAGRWIAYYDGA